MLKIFTTQLFGVFRKIQESEEDRIEDCARLLAQSVIGDGTIYVKGFDELEAIATVIVNSEERIPSVSPYRKDIELKPEDCLLVFSNRANDDRSLKVLEAARSVGASTVSVGAVESGQETAIDEFHIDTKLLKGLVPDDEGRRIGYPTFMCALYAYYALYFTVSEMLEEYDIED